MIARLFIGVVVLLAIASVGVGYVLFRYHERAKAYRIARHHQLIEIATACNLYYQSQGTFPPAVYKDPKTGNMHSWRVLVLEQLDQALYARYRFSEPWDSPHNLSLSDEIGKYYCYDSAAPQTELVGFVPASQALDSPLADAPASTILIAECYNSGIHVLEPRDLNLNAMSYQINDRARISIRGPYSDEAFAVTANAKLVRLSVNTSPQQLQAMLPFGNNIAPRRNRRVTTAQRGGRAT